MCNLMTLGVFFAYCHLVISMLNIFFLLHNNSNTSWHLSNVAWHNNTFLLHIKT